MKFKLIYVLAGTKVSTYSGQFDNGHAEEQQRAKITNGHLHELVEWVPYQNAWCVVEDKDPDSNEYGEVAP